jgi:hypothetical protein
VWEVSNSEAERLKVRIRSSQDLVKTEKQVQILKNCLVPHTPDALQWQPTEVGEGFSITRIDLEIEADIPNISNDDFQKFALEAKQNCPLSKALTGTEIHLTATLK